MSIVTKKGDQGTTTLSYNRQVSKCHPRVEGYGAVDELAAAIGLARSLTGDELVRETLFAIQKDLIVVMGELATLPEDLARYVKDNYPVVTASITSKLSEQAAELEKRLPASKGWSIPGMDPGSSALHVARTVCRRAERRVCALQENKQLLNREIVVYLNRLSDVLWLLARKVEVDRENSSTGSLLV
jgi:cob(I)alamin adenosyltransferase